MKKTKEADNKTPIPEQVRTDFGKYITDGIYEFGHRGLCPTEIIGVLQSVSFAILHETWGGALRGHREANPDSQPPDPKHTNN